ncbi:MAG: M28 family metallopeptidase [Bdellovibrionota bacterium]
MLNMLHIQRLRQDPRRAFLLSVLASATLIVLVFMAGIHRIPALNVWKGVPKFEAGNAYALTEKLSRQYPRRMPWRPERKAAAEFLKSHLRSLGYEASSIVFDEIIAGRKIEGLENVYAILPGNQVTDEYVVVLAHYDTTDTTIEGAADDASGVGTVLELARIFKNEKSPRRNLVFLLTDSEEFGAFWGAHQFVARFPHINQVVAAISLDFVAPEKQKSIMVLSDGLKNGYSPLWLRQLAYDSIRAVPFEADETRNILEFIQRAILIPPADHGAFLMAGIPAMNYFGQSEDFSRQMGAIHHTPLDNMDHLRLESFIPYGKAAEILMRSIDALPPLLNSPELRDSDYLKISETHYLKGWASRTIHFLMFFPFLTYVTLLLQDLKKRSRTHIFKVMRNEAKFLALIMTSLLSGYALLRLLPNLKIITKYEMFPATQKSSILYQPEYLALLLIVTFAATVYFLLSRLFASRAEDKLTNPIDVQIRHSLLGVTLGLITFFAFVKNSYLSTLMLMPPAYLWMFMKNNRKFDSRLLNALLFLGGLASFIAICIVLTAIFHIGVFYWYLFLAVSYGLISVYAAVLSLAVITVGIRILRNLVL